MKIAIEFDASGDTFDEHLFTQEVWLTLNKAVSKIKEQKGLHVAGERDSLEEVTVLRDSDGNVIGSVRLEKS